MVSKDKIKKAHDANYRESEEPAELPIVKGYDFDKFEINNEASEMINSYSNIGMQASNLGKAIEIAKEMRKENADIFLAYNSNMVSSGIRDIIRYLVKHKMVKALVTTTGGVEEDILKTFGNFYVGDFRADGAELRKKGINRIGNVFVPNNRYIEFEKMMHPFLKELLDEQRNTGHVHTPSEFIHKLGLKVQDEKSIYYWASRNNIPTFCPALTDGSIGDMIYFFRESDKRNVDFKIDIAADMNKLVNMVLDAKKTGVIILGGGIIKHHIMNANLYRNGADYTIYINTEIEEGGSDSGARPDEAVSWGKIKPGTKSVKVFCDATIAFPLLVAGAFRK
ncbi:MAG: deoxyhypusine synthase [Candidatus Micrarchaeia archaeon]